MSGTKNFLEIKETLDKWWRSIQFERKCSNTNLVQKIINNSSLEIQEQIRQVISQKIKELSEKCFVTKDINDLQCTCNAVNGCFDNFAHAVDAVRLSFSEVLFFINFGLAECEIRLNLRTCQKNTVLELLHSLSRILILVLKLGRSQNEKKIKNSQKNNCGIKDSHSSQKCRTLLSAITFKIGQFLIMDDILIDTKNNLSMSAILIREILIPNEDKLKNFHKNFIKSLPTSLSDESCKLNILKFLICSAIINTWSVNIVDSDSTYIYLKFFISLCEKYSSETPIVLNTSRTLLLLIKHESFAKFVTDSNSEKVEQIISTLLSCIFMLLEHPVTCVRHSAKDFLQLLAAHLSLHSVIIDSVFKLPIDKRSYFISIGALASEIGSEFLLKNNPELPAQLIEALHDPTVVSHVSLALEYVILNDFLAEKNFSKWCETYIVPLLISLMSVLPIVAADIEKLLEKAFKKHPNCLVYVIGRWANPTSSEELRYVVTALKISQKQGFKLESYNFSSLTQRNEKTEKNDNNLNREKVLISEKLLEHCLHQRDDDIRISAFSLLIEAQKSTKPYSEKDFRLIQYFLKYNLNNQQPAIRQKILGLIRKMLIRFSESRTSFLKLPKNESEQAEKNRNLLMYNQFLDSIIAFCFSNIFVGCNFNRLNTVLNILLLCFENVKDMSFKSDKTNFYWNKFLIALDSSYQENKDLVMTLAENLDLSLLSEINQKSAKSLCDKAFNLCTHMEPPDVLTGSYLLQILMKIPLSKVVLSSYFVDDYVFDDIYYYCIQILMKKLKEHVQLAKLDLMTASICGPMYGVLFAIRLTFKNVNFSVPVEKSVLSKWSKILNELVELCLDITRIVSCVVNSSSPEGHLSMDFQTDFQNLSFDFDKKFEMKGSNVLVSPSGKPKTMDLIRPVFGTFLKKFDELESTVESPNFDTYESLRSLSILMKENQLLISKIKVLNDRNHELTQEGDIEQHKLLDSLNNIKSKIECHLERLQKMNSVIEWTGTAQVLLLCAWRSIKEASLYFGDFFTKLSLETEIEMGLLTENTIVRVGEELKTLLCEIKHRGAFEHVYIGFMQLVNSLWKCSNKNLSNLPKLWLKDIINHLESPLSDQKLKLCSTRRSAGLPFLVQAIICSEVVSIKSATPSTLRFTMKSLLRILENNSSPNPDSKIHALNVLRGVFKHAQLGEYVAPYVSKALMAAICGSRAATWSERNSSNLLFSSLIIRIFGVSRSRDEISKKNRMTSRTFFQRYSELYDFLLSEMKLVYSKENYVDGLYPKPSLYLVLLILGRLYPPPTEDPENIDLSEFLLYINKSRRNPIMKIRELGARALVPLISFDRLIDELDDRFSVLSTKNSISENERHGILLQIKELLSQSQETFENLTKESSKIREISWIETTKWMLMSENPKQTSSIVLSCYVKILHIFYKNFAWARQIITETVATTSISKYLMQLSPKEQSLFPGIYLFLENFHFLEIDILASQCLCSNDIRKSKKFVESFMVMLKSEISEVQSISFRILCYALKENAKYSLDFDDDDFSGLALKTDLLLFPSHKDVKNLQMNILSNKEILNLLTEQLNKNNCQFESIIIHRMWLTVVSSLVMNGMISISHSTSVAVESSLKIDFAKSLIKSGDKVLSTSALICYAIYLMEEVSVKKEKMPCKDRLALVDILYEFSSSNADVRERLAVAKIMNRCCENFTEKRMISDPFLLKIWMIPFKLLADEDSGVRLESSELVHELQDHISKKIPSEKLLIKMKTLDWPHLPLVSLKAQECLMDSYINILGSENLIYLVVQMLIMALSSFCELDNGSYSKDEFGIFEKGNPNPYCEDLSLSDFMCQKLVELSSIENLETLIWSDLNSVLGEFIRESFQILDFIPQSLMEVIETVTSVVEETNKLKGDFSLPRIQVNNLRKALRLSELI